MEKYVIFITVLAYGLGYTPPRFLTQKGKSQIALLSFTKH